MSKYIKDKSGQEILLSDDGVQVMMGWEKPLMEACINILQPNVSGGTVLEVGFGLGLSANRIQYYKPARHVIIECDPDVIKKAREWAKDKENVKILEGTWQDMLPEAKKVCTSYSAIFFDATPQSKFKNYVKIYQLVYDTYIFIDVCLGNHMHCGSKISFFVSSYHWITDFKYRKLLIENPIVQHEFKMMDINVPNNCRYRTNKFKHLVPVLTKISQK